MRQQKVEVTSLSLGPEKLDRRKTPYVDICIFPTLKALRAFIKGPRQAGGACLVPRKRGKCVALICLAREHLTLGVMAHEAVHAANAWLRREWAGQAVDFFHLTQWQEEQLAERILLITEGIAEVAQMGRKEYAA